MRVLIGICTLTIIIIIIIFIIFIIIFKIIFLFDFTIAENTLHFV